MPQLQESYFATLSGGGIYDRVIVFAGLPDSYESEGYDRNNLDMPAGHNKLIAEVAKANANIVVVLMNGAAPILIKNSLHVLPSHTLAQKLRVKLKL